MADPAKMSLADFAKKIKSQHPEYTHLDNQELANRVLSKYPQYRQHVDMVSQPGKEASFGDQLTAGGSSEGAQKGDEWLSKNIPIAGPVLGKGLRALDAAGGAAMGIPSFLYHSVADPLSPQEQANGQGRLEAIPERLLGAEQTATALQDYGKGKVSPRAAMSVLPEALGTGMGTVAAGKMAEYGLQNAPRIPGVKPVLAKAARFGSDVVDPDITGILSPRLAHVQRALGRAANALEAKPNTEIYRDATMNPKNVPEYAGEDEPTLAPFGSAENPGLHSKIPLRVPASVLKEEAAANAAPGPPLGSPENPGPMAKLPMRVPQQVLAEEAEARAKAGGAETHRDATLDRRNVPEFAGEGVGEGGESPITSPGRISQYGRPGGRMARPFLPVIATPEDMQIFKNQMGILKPEAIANGMYSAARGAVSRVPDYQMRIGGKLRPFGPPEDLMEDSTPPVRRKVENE